jgi:serine carboxypeptidase 1
MRSHVVSLSQVVMAPTRPFAALLLLLCAAASFVLAAGTADGSEEWGYVQRSKSDQVIIRYRFGSHLESTGVPRSVRCSITVLCRGAHVLVAIGLQRVDNDRTLWPTVLWLQGGPVSDFSSIHLQQTRNARNQIWLDRSINDGGKLD